MLSNVEERFGRPRKKPVDAGVVDEPGEVPASQSESVPCRGEAQNDVQVVPSFVDKELSFLVLLDDPLFLSLVPYPRYHVIFFLFCI